MMAAKRRLLVPRHDFEPDEDDRHVCTWTNGALRCGMPRSNRHHKLETTPALTDVELGPDEEQLTFDIDG